MLGWQSLLSRAARRGGKPPTSIWSLTYHISGDETDCGLPASLILPAANFTVDAYWQHPATLPDNAAFVIVSQGDMQSTGWGIYLTTNSSNQFRAWAWVKSPFGNVDLAHPWQTRTPNAWHYFRLRWSAATSIVAFSIDACAEVTSNNYGFGYTQDLSSHFYHGRNGGATHSHLKGNLICVHAWNNDQGALLAVPTGPFAVGANTAGRWLHQDGSGAQLADSSGNNNHGTITGATWQASAPAGWTIHE
jgi:hypothetical protein